DAADPVVKAASAPVLEGAIRHARAHEVLLRRRTDDLTGAGYHGQVAVISGAANVFFHGPAGRERLYARGDAWVARESGVAFTGHDLHDAVERDPRQFSPNVFLRPVVESSVFPTLAYVGGPAEISYFAQLNPLFREFGMDPPVAFPRFSATLVTPRVEHALDRLGLAREELVQPEHRLVSRLARRRIPAGVSDALRGVREALAGEYARMIEAAEGIDPTLRGALGSLRNRSLLSAADAERKIVSAIARRSEEVTRGVRRVLAELRPNGEPQERVLNALPYLAVYGPDLLEEIAGEMEVRFRAAGPGSGARERTRTGPV
ncbi:MAG TPA: bacillithiol biosynthesis BshC, partial [Longimicrobiaceae bacterium]|nr:bacillithiol biosynthesis BshC [Longimicrobiaceae bacterium]